MVCGQRKAFMIRAIILGAISTLVVTGLTLCAVAAEDASVTPSPVATNEFKGALVICGGGRLPDAIRERFMTLAGGNGSRLVVIPTASEDQDLPRDRADLV